MFGIEDPAAFVESEGFIDALLIAGVMGVAYLTVLWIAVVLWTYRDVQMRTTAPEIHAASTLLVAVFSVPGLLLYLTARPKQSLVDSYNRQLEAEAFLQELDKETSCPDCRRAVDDSFRACPYCRSSLQAQCTDCGKSVKREWSACPYCGSSERTADPRVRQARERALPRERYPEPATRAAS